MEAHREVRLFRLMRVEPHARALWDTRRALETGALPAREPREGGGESGDDFRVRDRPRDDDESPLPHGRCMEITGLRRTLDPSCRRQTGVEP